MSYFGHNIKKIRTVKNLSQQAFADMFNLKRASVGAWEEGRAEPKLDTMAEIAEAFEISLDTLVRYDLKVNELLKFEGVEQIPFAGQPLFGKPDADFKQTQIPVLTSEHYSLGNLWTEKIFSPDFKPSISLPGSFGSNVFCMKIYDVSMHTGTALWKTDDYCICRLINSNELVHGLLYIVFTGSQALFGRFKLEGERKFFKPDNQNYPEFMLQNTFAIALVVGTIAFSNGFALSKMEELEKRISDIENKLN